MGGVVSLRRPTLDETEAEVMDWLAQHALARVLVDDVNAAHKAGHFKGSNGGNGGGDGGGDGGNGGAEGEQKNPFNADSWSTPGVEVGSTLQWFVNAGIPVDEKLLVRGERESSIIIFSVLVLVATNMNTAK